MRHGNISGLRADIKEVAHQLKCSRATLTQYRKKYGVCPYTLRRELLAVMSESQYLDITKAKLAQGNEPQRWTSDWGIRGAAARKYKASGQFRFECDVVSLGPDRGKRRE